MKMLTKDEVKEVQQMIERLPKEESRRRFAFLLPDALYTIEEHRKRIQNFFDDLAQNKPFSGTMDALKECLR